MQIAAGMGSIDDYPEYVKAGADEIFVGYVPMKWQAQYGLTTPLNRREVCYCNVQIGSCSELEILSGLVRTYGVPVTIAINGLHYRPEQYSLIAEIICDCISLNFRNFIIADPGLLVYLYQNGLTGRIHIHLSGDFGEINDEMLTEAARLGVTRLILHRKVSPESMRRIIANHEGPMEYEAFILNENCHFHGGYCNSLHCDELAPMCRMPYQTGTLIDTEPPSSLHPATDEGFYDYGTASLQTMQEIGITHLKIVGRGAYSEDMVSAIRYLKQLLNK